MAETTDPLAVGAVRRRLRREAPVFDVEHKTRLGRNKLIIDGRTLHAVASKDIATPETEQERAQRIALGPIAAVLRSKRGVSDQVHIVEANVYSRLAQDAEQLAERLSRNGASDLRKHYALGMLANDLYQKELDMYTIIESSLTHTVQQFEGNLWLQYIEGSPRSYVDKLALLGGFASHRTDDGSFMLLPRVYDTKNQPSTKVDPDTYRYVELYVETD